MGRAYPESRRGALQHQEHHKQAIEYASTASCYDHEVASLLEVVCEVRDSVGRAGAGGEGHRIGRAGFEANPWPMRARRTIESAIRSAAAAKRVDWRWFIVTVARGWPLQG
jgi:hypothetical protein